MVPKLLIFVIIWSLLMWLMCVGFLSFFALSGLQVYSHFVKPINGPQLWKKIGKGIVLAPDFKKQHGRPTKKCRREAGEYEEQTTKNKKLCRTGLVIKCRNCGREGHNKKLCYRQSHYVGPSTGPPPIVGPSVGPPSIATQPITGPPPTATEATVGPSLVPTPTPGPSPTPESSPTTEPPPTVGSSKTTKTPKSRGRPKLPARRNHK